MIKKLFYQSEKLGEEFVMKSLIVKSALTACIIFGGSFAFASTLNSVEVKTTSNDAKILLNTDYKSFVKKTDVSTNQIQLILKDTTINENIQTKYDNSKSFNGISLVQDGKDAYIYVSGVNPSSIEVVNAATNSIVPLNTHKKDFSAGIGILGFLGIVGFLSMFTNKRTKKVTKTLVEHSLHKNEIKNNIDIRNYTIRTSSLNSSSVSIHGNPTAKFAQDTSSFRSNNTNKNKNMTVSINSYCLKKAVNS